MKELTPHQQRYQAARQRNRDTALERHAVELGKVVGKLRDVLDLHGPRHDTDLFSGHVEVVCHGCDWGTHAEAGPVWPCSTWVLITEEDENQWWPPIEDVGPGVARDHGGQ